MKTSARGLRLIIQREGRRLVVYRDSKGLPTVGIGHLVTPADNLKLGDRITKEQCDAFFAQDVSVSENAVNSAVKVPLNQNQYDALVSVTVNIGVRGFTNSTIVKRLNRGDYKGASDAILLWNKPPEIRGRRKQEYDQFRTPTPQGLISTPADPEPADLSAPDTSIEVKAEKPSLLTKIGAGITAAAGIGINAGSLIQSKLEALTPAQILYLALALGLVGLGVYWYRRSAENAQKRNLALIQAAADPAQNTVKLC